MPHLHLVVKDRQKVIFTEINYTRILISCIKFQYPVCTLNTVFTMFQETSTNITLLPITTTQKWAVGKYFMSSEESPFRDNSNHY